MFDNFAAVEATEKRKQLHCVECRRETIHSVEACCRGMWSDTTGPDEENQFTVEATDTYSIWRCGACDHVSFEHRSWFSEDDGPVFRQYPPVSSATFVFDTEYVASQLEELIGEMLYALAGSKLTLAAVGLRMIVEWIVNEQGCTGRNLADKIKKLRSREIVSEDQEAFLHIIRVKANAGAHEAQPMTQREIVGGMNVINLLLEKLYNRPARETKALEVAQRALAPTERSAGRR